MQPNHNLKIAGLAAVSQNAAASTTTTWSIDRKGYDAASIMLSCPAATEATTGIKWSSFVLCHATNTAYDTSNALIAGTTEATAAATEFVMAASKDTANPASLLVNVDCRGLERYLVLKASCPASTDANTLWGHASLARGQSRTDDATTLGVTGFGAC